LRAITGAGCVVSLLAISGLLLAAGGLLPLADLHAGELWLGAGLSLLGGIQLISLGIIGAYLARIHTEVRGRPLYITRERLGFHTLPRPVPNILEFISSEVTERQESATLARLKANRSGELVPR